MSVAVEAPALVEVTCSNPACGRVRLVSTETARKIRYGRASGLCLPCGKMAGPNVRVTASMRRFWLDRFTEEQIVEMAEALFGPRSRWPSESAAA